MNKIITISNKAKQTMELGIIYRRAIALGKVGR